MNNKIDLDKLPNNYKFQVVTIKIAVANRAAIFYKSFFLNCLKFGVNFNYLIIIYQFFFY